MCVFQSLIISRTNSLLSVFHSEFIDTALVVDLKVTQPDLLMRMLRSWGSLGYLVLPG